MARKTLTPEQQAAAVAKATAPVEANRQRWRDEFLDELSLRSERPSNSALRAPSLFLLDHPYLLRVPTPDVLRTLYWVLEAHVSKTPKRRATPRELAGRVDRLIDDRLKHGIEPSFGELRGIVARSERTTIDAVTAAHVRWGRHKGRPGRPKKR